MLFVFQLSETKKESKRTKPLCGLADTEITAFPCLECVDQKGLPTEQLPQNEVLMLHGPEIVQNIFSEHSTWKTMEKLPFQLKVNGEYLCVLVEHKGFSRLRSLRAFFLFTLILWYFIFLFKTQTGSNHFVWILSRLAKKSFWPRTTKISRTVPSCFSSSKYLVWSHGSKARY